MSSILSLLGKTMVKSDAWNKKTGAHASILEMELMHEAENKGPCITFHLNAARLSPGPPVQIGKLMHGTKKWGLMHQSWKWS